MFFRMIRKYSFSVLLSLSFASWGRASIPTSSESEVNSPTNDGHCTRDNCAPTTSNADCDMNEAMKAFMQKRLSKPVWNLELDPYAEEIDADQERIFHAVVDNRRINCGVHYLDKGRNVHELRTFPNERETTKAGFQITHYGRCGACSS